MHCYKCRSSKARALQQGVYGLRKAIYEDKESSEQQSKKMVTLLQGQHCWVSSSVEVHAYEGFDGKQIK